MIFASGLIAGGAIMGIILAIPFVLNEEKGTNALSIVSEDFAPIADIFGVLVAIAVCIGIYNITVKGRGRVSLITHPIPQPNSLPHSQPQTPSSQCSPLAPL